MYLGKSIVTPMKPHALLRRPMISVLLIWLTASARVLTMTHPTYDGTMITVTSSGTPDPFVIRSHDRYCMTFTRGTHIELWTSNSLLNIESLAEKQVIWKPPSGTAHSEDLWAPELHALRGRWYIYYAAAPAANDLHDESTHRMFVLGGPPATEDPCARQDMWEFLGPVKNMPEQWAIDGTILDIDNKLYLVYSGWTLPNMNLNLNPNQPSQVNERPLAATSGATGKGLRMVKRNDRLSNWFKKAKSMRKAKAAAQGFGRNYHTPTSQQHLFIVRLDDPLTAGSEPVCISSPRKDWELTHYGAGDHGINEGPQWLESPDGSWRGLVFSCAGSWTQDYKMGVLTYTSDEPLSPFSWVKSDSPLLESRVQPYGSDNERYFGPGHGSFIDLGEGDVVAIYHATDLDHEGWANRKARVQRVAFTEKGPYMGEPLTATRHRRDLAGGKRWSSGVERMFCVVGKCRSDNGSFGENVGSTRSKEMLETALSRPLAANGDGGHLQGAL
ncbi:glycosyl hydrolase [Xylariaceae sp. FL0255]|nr:glycosyl hydrolase [Xylariaceae sp. FL0255]